MARDLVDRGSRAGRGLRERAALARRPQGRRLRDPRHERVDWALFDFALGSIGAIGAPIYANSSTKDAGYILDHSESVGVLCEDEVQRAKVEEVRGGIPRLAARPDLRRPRRPGGARPRLRGRASERVARGGRRDRGGRPLHVHLHVRHDRPAQGLHDLAPELLRDGRGRRRPAELHRPRGHDAPLPPARAQLRPPDAPLGRVRRLRDRVPARPASGRGRAALGEADRLPERASGVREDPHRGRRSLRRGDGTRAAGSWTGRSGSAAASARLRRAGKPVPRGLAAQYKARRQARLQEGEGTPRRQAAHGDLRRRAALTRDRGVLPCARHPADRGLRADRVHDGRIDEHARGLPLRHRRASAPGHRGSSWPRTGSC